MIVPYSLKSLCFDFIKNYYLAMLIDLNLIPERNHGFTRVNRNYSGQLQK